MSPIDLDNIIVQPISWPLLEQKNISIDVLRLDLIHPIITGNKWFKLRYYLEDAKRSGKKTIVTWGGAWSNHIVATAFACQHAGFDSIGLIRGEQSKNPTATLQQANALGMQFYFVDREQYREKKIPPGLETDSNYFIPEGGYGKMGMEGAATILDHCKKEEYSHFCAAVGTGTMMAGLLNSALPSQKLIGISVLKNNRDAEEKIRSIAGFSESLLTLMYDYHFGGYAKCGPGLTDFMNEFYRVTNIPSDFVYTGKLFYAVTDLIAKDYFPPGTKLLVIHSGGLQGNASLEKGTLIF